MKEFQVADLPIVALTLLTLASSTPVTSPATTVVTQPTNLTRFILNSNYSATSTSNCPIVIANAIQTIMLTVTRAEGEKVDLPCIVHNIGGIIFY